MSGFLLETNKNKRMSMKGFIDAFDKINHFANDDFGFYIDDKVYMGSSNIDMLNDDLKQPSSLLENHLIFNGEIYNFEELNHMLKDKVGFGCDAKLLLKLLNEYGIDIVDKIDGMFSFCYKEKDTIYLVRDHAGIKPLYYTIYEDELLASSEIKGLLSLGVKAIMKADEINELIGMFPSHSQGKTLFKDIKEVKPGYYVKYDGKNLEEHCYFNVKRIRNDYSYEENIKHVKDLVKESIKMNLKPNFKISSLLSGGLDSSIVSSVYKDISGNIDTYSIDYEGNSKDFKANKFETSKDEDFIKIFKNKNGFNHKSLLVDNNTLFDYLKTIVIFRDTPGMAEIDSSMLYLGKEITKKYKCVLSGECADELFGGYPWYKDLDINSFPWIRNLDFKIDLLNDNIKSKIDVKKYVNDEFVKAINEAPVSKNDSLEEVKELQMNYINIKYFMTSLLDRTERIFSSIGLEARVPFASKKIIEYTYNLPLKMKSNNKIEKAILRDAFKEYLPKEVYNRHKSPYPKSQSLMWHNKIKQELLKVLDTNAPLLQLFSKDKILSFINGEELDLPWYGQLMRKDAFMAFLYQINYWLEEYKVRIEI